MVSEDFRDTIDIWTKDIDELSYEQLCKKPTQNSWSLGQVCVHLTDATNYFLEQAIICISNNENTNKEMKIKAKVNFRNNEFPDEVIEGPLSNNFTPQPTSKEEILSSFAKIKESIVGVENQISKSKFNGKTKHPGLDYFSADEWLQFAEMHFRHHFRQRDRIKAFLKISEL